MNHDECMTLLANAGIYLVLDVNSPIPGQSLNRYEPWSSYTPSYVNHYLKVVHQFSAYNNTLGFFAGNEVINDEISAKESSHYMKAITRDIHQYMRNNCPRQVPIGYSAADDLRFRVSLAKYMECGDDDVSVDFYGVNSYQWCGYQTFETSGFDILVRDYEDYTIPLFLSEYGCNAVMPRLFQEVQAVYSLKMTNVFSGGLIYEYAQEPNNYGLVDIHQNGSAQIMVDYNTLQVIYNTTKVSYDFSKDIDGNRPKQCKKAYPNLNAANPIPECPAPELIKSGIKDAKFGSYVDVTTNTTLFSIYTVEQKELGNKMISTTNDWKTPIQEQLPWLGMNKYVNIEDGDKHKDNGMQNKPMLEDKPGAIIKFKDHADNEETSAGSDPISRVISEKISNAGIKMSKKSTDKVSKVIFAGVLIAPLVMSMILYVVY